MTQPRPNEFIPPPECPVFEPSWEEFDDPFAFINKIRPIAEKTGICKIRPPQGWQPPFACDVDRLHFTPRVQRLNELEAQTRVKLNFLDQIAKFWELQGCTLKIPHVERKSLDLYQLYTLVIEEGCFDTVCRERKWTQIALRMGFAPGKAVGSHLRSHYERILYPYYLFQTGANLVNSQKPTLTNDTKDKIYKSHDLPQRQSVQPVETSTIARRAKRSKISLKGRCSKNEQEEECKNRPNLRRRMGSYVAKPDEVKSFPVQVKQEPMEQVETMPNGEKSKECGKPQVAFGFEQASRDYTLRSFGDMADSFKSDYFNMPVHMVPTELVEKEFWRLVNTIEEDVTVEYGADIASKDYGSGFPVRNGSFKHYLNCGWNLNNMPVLDASVLTHITADICGMKLPWLYVGMCFSSFCWHIEDHWSYSVNYLHWGEPKTWYGAPGFAAEQLEAVMKKLAPELFESQPDLLHQLVTIMNPNLLMEYGVPIYRTNQCAGEFVITFPRAYHSGFNQGFNFAEAVNFCTVDWMPLGRQCVEHYRSLNRYCVFSHDEMICNIAAKANSLDLELASAIQKDMRVMIQEEKELREKAYKLGVWHSQQVDYDEQPDEERQCSKCRTTCYLSAITCPCSPGQLVCLHHIEDFCSCAPNHYTLNYKYTLGTLNQMFKALATHAESYSDWASKVNKILKADQDNKSDLEELRALIVEAEKMIYPELDLLFHLKQTVNEAEKSALMAQQLLNGKRQTRYRSGGGKSQKHLTVEELRLFVQQLYDLPCTIRQAPFLKALLSRVRQFQEESSDLLAIEMPGSSALQAALDEGSGLEVDLPELDVLRQRLEQARWVEAVQLASTEPTSLTLELMRKLIDQGVGLEPHACVERTMAHLQELLTVCEQCEEKAHRMLVSRPCQNIETLEKMLLEVSSIQAYLPNCLQLQDSVLRAREWIQEAEALQLGGRVPGFSSLNELILKAKGIPVLLEPLARLESLVFEVQAWKESAAKMFLLKYSSLSLLEMATLCEVRLKEMENLNTLRTVNNAKFLPTNSLAPTVCLCHTVPAGPMLQCELCLDAYHSGCVPGYQDTQAGHPWLCPLCIRTEKPPLDKVLPLLASLQRIRVRLPEGDALRFMIERTVRWQHRVQQDLALVVQKDAEKPDKNSKRHLEKETLDMLDKDTVKKPKKKKIRTNKQRIHEKRTICSSGLNSDSPSSEDSEEDWSICSAKQCQQPEGNEVNWVQCDGNCNQWFHQICVGVSAEQAEKEDYVCTNCLIKNHLTN
ncbi:lysine-specific demethylase 5B isoform X2 [Silurus meridionalis]|nr:lysine-specific demethylase 5B isoform X2 [Silurus meridionalis]